MSLGVFVIAVATAALPWFPHPFDKDGWGLRVHSPSLRGPYLVDEDISLIRFPVTLHNFSNEIRPYDPLAVLQKAEKQRVYILQPDGTYLPNRYCGVTSLDPKRERPMLRPGEFASFAMPFGDSGQFSLPKPGRYQLEVSFYDDRNTFKAPLFELEVLEVPHGALLIRHDLSHEGFILKYPVEERPRAAIEQMKLDGRTWLVYRRMPEQRWGGSGTFSRVSELPGRVEMQISGGYGDFQPLTITYPDPTRSSRTIKHVISPVNGMPWSQEEQDLAERLRSSEEAWREKQLLLKLPRSSPPAPAPRPVVP